MTVELALFLVLAGGCAGFRFGYRRAVTMRARVDLEAAVVKVTELTSVARGFSWAVWLAVGLAAAWLLMST